MKVWIEYTLEDFVQVRFKKICIWSRVIAREIGQRAFRNIAEVE